MKIVVSGSSGLVGRPLVASLRAAGHQVRRLVRHADQAGATDAILWDPAAGRLDPVALSGADAVVNLNGRSIGDGRWTESVKEELWSSRIDSTRLLVDALAAADPRPRVMVSASAVGYYGDRGEETLDEGSPPGDGFLAELARAWEEAAHPARDAGARVVTLRLGMVVADGGALEKMLLPFKLGLGGPIGSGRQWWPWVALADVLGVVATALDDDRVDGPVNVVSPDEVRCKEFTSALGRVLHRPTVLPLPAFAARLALGEMADALLLASARVRPAALESVGYRFRLPELEDALRRAVSADR